jgi:uncharacterized delta-60 repeat protein
MSVYYCESCLTNQKKYIDGGSLPIILSGDPTIIYATDFRCYEPLLEVIGNLNPLFDIGTGFNDYVFKIAIQSDGKILVGGNFTTYAGLSKNRIVRLNSDYTIDNTYIIGSGFDGSVNSIGIQNDGKSILGGDFTTYNGVSKNRVVRLNVDGTVDNTFNIGVGFNGSVESISIQPDGKILIGGLFTLYNGLFFSRVVRLNSDGSVDDSFLIINGFNGGVYNTELQSDGKILVGGDFTQYNGYNDWVLDTTFEPTTIPSTVNDSIKDGSGDILFGYGTGLRKVDPTDGSTIYEVTTDNTVNSLEVLSGSSILVGGNFITYSGLPINRLLKIDSSGYKDNTFDNGAGFNSTVLTTKELTDGKILVGGNFTSYGANQVDTSFNLGFGNSVTIMVEQSDGKFLVGGNFLSYYDISANRIIRLNTDGSVDFSFNTGTGFNVSVLTIALQTDGKILVGGNFTSYNGVVRNRIIRLNTDGSIDTSFVIGNGFNGTVNTIALQPDGKILVGGSFGTYGGVSRNRIIRLNTNGSTDTGFVIGTGFNSVVRSILLQSDGKILVGGDFSSYGGVGVSRIVRLNTGGTRDTSFVIGTGFDNSVQTIALQSDGKILVGGSFGTYSGVSINYIVRLNTDGSIDTSFVIGTGFNNFIQTINLRSDGKILVGGGFTSYSGVSINGSILLNTNGSIDLSFSMTGSTGAANNTVRGFLPKIGFTFVYGDFSSYNSIPQLRLSKINYSLPTPFSRYSRLNSDGSLDLTFYDGIGFDNSVNKINTQSDGKIIVAGDFTQYSGVSANKIVRLNTDDTIDETFNTEGLFNGNINSFDIQSDGKIIIGGSFEGLQLLSNAISYFDGYTTSIVLQPDGKILIGGEFTSYSGVSRNGIIRLNSDYTIDTSFINGNGFDGIVGILALQSDGKILVGGNFTSYSGVSRNNIIRLNTDGSVDTSFVIGTGFNNSIETIKLQTDGKILVGGLFTSYNGLFKYRIIRLNTNGSIDNSFVIGTGFNDPVFNITSQSDGKILVGGNFTSYGTYSIGDLNINFSPTPISSNINNSIKDLNGDIIVGYGTGIRKVDPISGSTIYEVSTNSTVNSLEVLSGSSILVGGNFTTYSGLSSNNLIKINEYGEKDVTFFSASPFNNTVLTTKELSNGKILVGGNFTSYGVNQVDTSFNLGFNNGVFSMVEQSDGKFLVAGSFISYGGSGANGIVRLNVNGTRDNTFNPSIINYGGINSIAVQSDGTIFVVGFISNNSESRWGILGMNSSGTVDSRFGSGFSFFNDSPVVIKLQPDGKLLVGGYLTEYNGNPIGYGLIRLESDGTVDTTFDVGTGFLFLFDVGSVSSIQIQSDGKILVGGNFTEYNGTSVGFFVRLESDGTIDTTFNIGTGFNTIVTSIALQSDGKIIVGGEFTSYSGVSSNYIIRLNTNGSVDTSFVVGTGFNGNVNTIALQPDGKILVGGGFTSYSGVSINRSILLNTNGSIDLSFSMTGSTGAANNTVRGFLPKSGFTYVYGDFTSYNSISQSQLTKISNTYVPFIDYGRYSRLNSDGSLDLTFLAGTGFTSAVNKIDTQSDGKILVAGTFTQYSGIQTNKIVRLNTDNTLDPTFNNGGSFNGDINSFDIQSDGKIIVGGTFTELITGATVSNFNNTVFTTVSQPDGKILVGGNFSTYGGVSRNRIIRLNTDYTVDTSFVIGTGFNSVVRSILLESDGKILVGGDFSSYSGITSVGKIRLNTNGSLDTEFNQNQLNGSVYSIITQSDNKILMGGNFTRISPTITAFNNVVTDSVIQSDGKMILVGGFTNYAGVSRNRIIRLNTDNTIDNTFVIGTGFGSTVNTITLQSDGKILVGGDFTSYSGVTRNRIIRLNTDGSVDTGFVIGTGFDTTVNDITVQSDGKILVGGQFTSYSGITSVGKIRLNTNGSLDTEFNQNQLNGSVNSITTQSDNKILIGGSFTRISSIITAFDNTVIDSTAQSDGKIILVGDFTNYSGISRNRIIRLNTDNSVDNTFNIGNGFNLSAYTVSIQSDGKILVGGDFTSYSGLSTNRIIRLNTDGSVDSTFTVGSGFSGLVDVITVQSDGKILIGGNFTSYGGYSSSRVIRLNTDGSVDTTFSVESGFNNIVNDITTQSDGKVLVGGAFTTYGGYIVGGLNTSFTPSTISSSVKTTIKDNDNDIIFGFSSGIRKVDSSVGSTIYSVTTDRTVNSLEVLSGTSILVGGNFTTYSSITSNGLVKIDSSGYKDNTFDVGGGFGGEVLTTKQLTDGKVLVGGSFSAFNNTQINTSFSKGFNGFTLYDMVEQSDGKLLAVGLFTSYSGVSYNNIIRLNTDGSIDTSFVIGVGFNNSPNAITTQSDGKILTGGFFTSYSGVSRNRIIRLNTDGSIDNSFNIGTGFSDYVNAIVVQSDGKILVGGNFTSYSGVSRNRIIRLNTDGSVDSSFVIGTGFNGYIQSLILQPDGKIIGSGSFTTYSGVSRNNIIRLNTNGSVDNSFVIGTGLNSVGYELALQSDGKIIVGGFFTSYSGVSKNYIVRLNTDGSIDNSFVIGTGFNGTFSAVSLRSDGKILVGGYFTSYSGVTANRSILLNSDGSVDTSFILSGSSGGANANVRGFIPKSGFTYVYGEFTTYNGISQLILSSVSYSAGTPVNVGNYVRLNSNGSYDLTFSAGTGFTSSINKIETQSDGKIIVATNSTFYSGTQINGIVRLNSDNSLDQTFYSPYKFDSPVKSFAIQSDGKIIAGGDFSSVRVFSNFNGFGVYNITLQSDGKILVGGLFTTYNGVSRNNIIRLNSDYSIDPTFSIGTGFNNSVRTTQLQPDGKILVGGEFTSYSGVSKNYFVRLNSDGSIDNSFISGFGFNGAIYSTQVQSDGKIIVGGGFTSYSGVSRNDIIRLNTDGSIDTSFVIGTGSNGEVRVITLQTDGKILVGGTFTSYSGVSSNRIIRLNTNGSIDTSFVIGSGFNANIFSTQIQPDGKILVGGGFTSYSGVSRNRIIRLNTDGSVDTGFVIGTGFDNVVWSIQLQSDGKILAGGDFTSYSGITNPSVILLNGDGSKNTSFNSSPFGAGFGTRTIYSVSSQSNGNILIGGTQDTYNNTQTNGMTVLSSNGDYSQQRRYIARLNTDGTIDPTFDSFLGFNGLVSGVTIQSDGKVLVTGSFTSYSGISSNRIARLNSDGSYDTTFVVGTGFGSTTNTLTLVSNDYVLVGGNFTSYNGSSTTRLVQLVLFSLPVTNANRIIRLNSNGSVDNTFVIGTGFTSGVNTVTIQNDGKILAGGDFTSYSGVSRNRIIRLNTDGSVDNNFIIGTGFAGNLNAITLQTDGKILVGGNFTSYSGLSINDIIRLNTDGSIDSSFTVGTGFNNQVYTILQKTDNSILVGGSFTTYNGLSSLRMVTLSGDGSVPNVFNYTNIVRLNIDGSVDNTFIVGTGFTSSVNTTTTQSDGKILVGGQFTSYSGVSSNRIIRLNTDGSVDTSFVIGTGFGSTVSVTTLQSDGKIIVGGDFTSYSGASRNRIIRLNTDGSVDTSFVIGTGFNGTVQTISLKSDGKILVGGAFTSYNSTSQLSMVTLNTNGSTENVFDYNRIVRLNTNSSVDTSFVIGTGFNNFVYTIALQPDGKILVGGEFTSYSGVSRNYIIRLNTDGSIDNSFVIGTGFNNFVYTIALQPDGKILVGGVFTSYSGVTRNRIIRLNTDGSIDNSFVIGTGFGTTVNNITVQSDGKILVCGVFTSYSGVSSNRIIRLNTDGSIDNSFVIGTGFNSTAQTIYLKSDGNIIVGGTFTSYNGTVVGYLIILNSSGQIVGKFSCGRIARLNSNGEFDVTFTTPIGFNNNVTDVSIQPDNKVFVSGIFTSYSGITSSRFARINSDGSYDTTFVVNPGFNTSATTITQVSSDYVLVGGNFTSYDNIETTRLVQLNLQSNSGTSANRIIRLNSDGSADNTFVIGSGFNKISEYTLEIQIQSDGKILVGGNFTEYNGTSVGYSLIRLGSDGTIDTTFDVGNGFGYFGALGSISSIALQSDGKILVGGLFDEYNGTSVGYSLIRLESDGTIDTTFDVGTGIGYFGDPGNTYSIALQSDGKILVGGLFDEYDNFTVGNISVITSGGTLDNVVPLERIARLNTDGTIDTTFSASTGFDNTVTDVSIQADGKVFATGSFTTYSGFTVNKFARLNSDGTFDSLFLPNVGFNLTTNTVTQESTDNVIVGGEFTSYDGIPTTRLVKLSLESEPPTLANRIIRLNTNGTPDSSFVIGTGFNDTVKITAIQTDGKILVGGQFTTYSGLTRNKIVRLNADGSVDSLFNTGTGFNDDVNTIDVLSDGRIMVGGLFTSYSGISANYVLRLNTNGVNDDSFDVGSGFNGEVFNITSQNNDDILLGGDFTTLDSESYPRFALILDEPIQGEYIALELFSDCEVCNGYIIPKSANTEYIECLICEGDALLVDAPHPVWTGLNGGAVTQLDAVTIGGNGWNS